MGYRMSNDKPALARRLSSSRSPYRLHYIFSEGEKTESMYFNALSKYANKSDEIEIRVMDRWTINKGNSNQYKITLEVEKYINSIQSLDSDNIQLLDGLTNKLKEQELTVADMFQLVKIVMDLEQDAFIHEGELLLQQINTILTMSDYDKEFDKICIILDRDKQSFKAFQYEEVLNIAEKNDYTLGISNPNFEFFLLLHMNDLSVLSTEELINNPKVTSKKRLMESLLKDECKKNDTTFNKNNYDCEWFLDNFENGYTNSLNYAHEVEELKESPGSSLFNILQEWIKP